MSVLLAVVLAAVAQEGFYTVGGIDGKGPDGGKEEGKFGVIHHSPDGKTWTRVFKGGPVKGGFTHAKNNMLRCLAFGNGRLVATGNAKAAVVSEDGKTWRVVEAPSGAFSVEFGNGIFLAPSASHFMISRDGLKWERVKQPGDYKVWGPDGAGHVRKTLFGNGIFLLAGEQRVGVTKDGTAWRHHRILPEERRPGRFSILFGAGTFLWLRQNRPHRISEDGISWRPIDLESESFEGCWTGKEFVVAGKSAVHRSADGLAWTKEAAKGAVRPLAAGNGILLGNQGWSKSFTISTDGGRTWEGIKPDVPSRRVYFFDGSQIFGPGGG